MATGTLTTAAKLLDISAARNRDETIEAADPLPRLLREVAAIFA